MSRRAIAPVLLLIAAALSIAAVFVVHDIEAAGGPLSQPSAVPPFVSPNGDGIQDEVDISFTTKRPERITLEIQTLGGELVERLLDDARIDGRHTERWQPDGVGDGTYRAVITRAGDRREYETTSRIRIDTREPRGSIDRTRTMGERVTGVALMEPGSDLRFFDEDGTELDGRAFAPPNPDAVSAQPRGPVPAGLDVRLWYVEEAPREIVLEDQAGNRRSLDAAVVG